MTDDPNERARAALQAVIGAIPSPDQREPRLQASIRDLFEAVVGRPDGDRGPNQAKARRARAVTAKAGAAAIPAALLYLMNLVHAAGLPPRAERPRIEAAIEACRRPFLQALRRLPLTLWPEAVPSAAALASVPASALVPVWQVLEEYAHTAMVRVAREGETPDIGDLWVDVADRLDALVPFRFQWRLRRCSVAGCPAPYFVDGSADGHGQHCPSHQSRHLTRRRRSR